MVCLTLGCPNLNEIQTHRDLLCLIQVQHRAAGAVGARPEGPLGADQRHRVTHAHRTGFAAAAGDMNSLFD